MTHSRTEPKTECFPLPGSVLVPRFAGDRPRSVANWPQDPPGNVPERTFGTGGPRRHSKASVRECGSGKSRTEVSFRARTEKRATPTMKRMRKKTGEIEGRRSQQFNQATAGLTWARGVAVNQPLLLVIARRIASSTPLASPVIQAAFFRKRQWGRIYIFDNSKVREIGARVFRSVLLVAFIPSHFVGLTTGGRCLNGKSVLQERLEKALSSFSRSARP